ncbi:MAG: esterase-like activity of phytase family protein [Xanthobacteraceae bacterium]
MSAAESPQPCAPTRRTVLAIVAAALLLPPSVGRAEPDKPRVAEPPVRIEVRARPILSFEPRDPSRHRFGQLEFRGGVELTSSYKEFGGVSAIRVRPDGAHFLALTDQGRWLRGRLTYDGMRPTGIADAEMAPILGADGRPLAARRWYDTESIAEDDGIVYVGIERVHQIVRLDYAKHGLLARGQPIPVPPGFKQLPSNGSIEALEFVPKGLPLAGTLIAISERGYDEAGNLKAFLIGGPSLGTFAVKRSDDFDVSDCALLLPGELLILERRYSLWRGVALRIRRIPLASIKPGALVDGPVVVLADMGYEIDNMEGLSVHRTAAGDTVLTLISDDNFSAIQRTILLQFTLVEE